MRASGFWFTSQRIIKVCPVLSLRLILCKLNLRIFPIFLKHSPLQQDRPKIIEVENKTCSYIQWLFQWFSSSYGNFWQMSHPFVITDFWVIEVYLCFDLFTDPILVRLTLQGLATWSGTYASAAWLAHQAQAQRPRLFFFESWRQTENVFSITLRENNRKNSTYSYIRET